MKTRLLCLLLIILSSKAISQIPTNGLVAQYGFDNGNFLVDPANGNNLTQVGTLATSVDDRFRTLNNAINLGGDHFTRTDIAINNTNNFSVSFWIKTTTNDSNTRVILNDDTRTSSGLNLNNSGYHIWYQNGRIHALAGINAGCAPSIVSTAIASSNVVSDGNWHHVAIVIAQNGINSNITARLYLDGIINNSDTSLYACAGGLETSGNVVLANVRPENASHKYEDVIDDILFYNRVLSGGEVGNIAAYNNYCFAPNTINFSITNITDSTSDVSISETGTFDIAYHDTTESFSNATIITNVASGTETNLTGLTGSKNYRVYIRKHCTTSFVSDWSSAKLFRTSGRIYVNDTATGDNDGSSWADAYVDLQDALALDVDGQEIWVAGGTYKASSSDVTISYVIDKSNVQLYGGFAGTETNLSQRILGVNPTIITGDLNNDDTNDLFVNASRSDNTRKLITVVNGSSNFLIDGFVLRDAHAHAGMNILDGLGAAIFNEGGNTGGMIRNCTFYRNGSHSTGTAIFTYSSGGTSEMTIDSCVFEENFGRNGVVSGESFSGRVTILNITNSQFINNTTLDTAGAVYANYSGNNSELNIDACKFIGNNSRSGGAIYTASGNNASINVAISNSLFDANIAEDNALTANSGSSAWIRAIGGNSTVNTVISNNTFVNNIDLGTGNGLNNFNRATLVLSINGGAVHNATTANNIFYDNTTVGGVLSRSITGAHETLANVTVLNSIDQDSFSSIPSGNLSNVSNANPMFTDAANNDFTLLVGSPAIDSGDNSEVLGVTDLAGNSRTYNTAVDMGAYESSFGSNNKSLTVNVIGSGTVNTTGGVYTFGSIETITATPNTGSTFLGWQGDATGANNPLSVTLDANKVITAVFKQPIFVDTSASGNNDGTSWIDAYTNLQDALASAQTEDEIWIAAGIYHPHTSNRSVYFDIAVEDLKIYGGFAGTEADISERIIGANETILSADLNNNDINVANFSGNYGNTTRNADNSYHIINITSTGNNLLLDGITISDAHQNINATELGAAIVKHKSISHLTLKQCIIKNNVSRQAGAGLIAEFELNNFNGTSGELWIENCQFINNMARYGGGIYSFTRANTKVNITIINTLYDGNIATDLNNSTAKGLSGSASWLRTIGHTSTMEVRLINNTYVNNFTGGTNGGLTNNTRATVGLTKATNTASNTNLTANVSNCVFWNNKTLSNSTTRSITSLYDAPANAISVYNSIDELDFNDSSISTKTNTINTNPLFTDLANGDYTLQAASPAVDTGNNTFVTTSVDLLGHTRIFNTTVDMGVYEYNSTLSIPSIVTTQSFKIFPNPTEDVLNIVTQLDVENIRIFNVLGEQIFETDAIIVDVSQLKSGVYFIQIEDNQHQVLTKRFVKK